MNKTQDHTISLSDLVNVKLYTDNLKMFDQAWEETLLSSGNDLDDIVLENLYERQVGKTALIKNALTLYQRDGVLKKELRSYQRLRTMVNDILEQQRQNRC